MQLSCFKKTSIFNRFLLNSFKQCEYLPRGCIWRTNSMLVRQENCGETRTDFQIRETTDSGYLMNQQSSLCLIQNCMPSLPLAPYLYCMHTSLIWPPTMVEDNENSQPTFSFEQTETLFSRKAQIRGEEQCDLHTVNAFFLSMHVWGFLKHIYS